MKYFIHQPIHENADGARQSDIPGRPRCKKGTESPFFRRITPCAPTERGRAENAPLLSAAPLFSLAGKGQKISIDLCSKTQYNNRE
jgi:hypothetical protein